MNRGTKLGIHMMEGKFELQFEDNEYYLVDGNSNDTVATTDKVLLKEYDGYMKKLSFINCEAIANGYDLNDIINENCDKWNTEKANGIEIGFQKALEILGDKKFSEDDLDKVIEMSRDIRYITYSIDDIIQSLQQTEWDVEIVIECGEVKQCECSSNENCLNPQPKLDEDGCLILKKKS